MHDGLSLRSVRARFTLWYAGALAATFLLFSAGIYFSVRTTLMMQVREELTRKRDAVASVLRTSPAALSGLEEYGSVPFFYIPESGAFSFRSRGWDEIGLDRALQNASTSPYWIWETPTDIHFMVHRAEVPMGSRTVDVLIADEIESVLRSLRSLFITLLIGIPITSVLALVGGYLLAGRVLEPVGEMASKAASITADRLSERLPVVNPEDEFGRLATVFNDTLARLESSFDNLRRFTADASHELRTPLTSLRSVGEVGLQEQDRSPAFYRDVIGSMLEETDRLARLVDNLLTLTRADAGQMSATRERVDLAALALDAIDHIRVLAEEKNQKIGIEGEEHLVVETDRQRLRQALLNILDNAIRYTPSGGRVTVFIRRRSAGRAVMEISDTGPGIPAEHQEKVFERFYRVDPGRSSETGGAGLGLAIARWAIRLCGGRVELESREGTGSTFRIVLLAAPESDRSVPV